MSEPTPKPAATFLAPANALQTWREALAHLRHLSDDVTRCWTLFLSVNIALTSTICLILLFAPPARMKPWLTVGLCVAGAMITLAGRYLLKRHRIYYLQMLAKKTLIEEHLGCYENRIAGSSLDLALPWHLTPEVAAEIRACPEAWVTRSIRSPGTMARVQFWILEGFLLAYFALLVAAHLPR